MTEIIIAAAVGIAVGAVIVWLIQESRWKTNRLALETGKNEELEQLRNDLAEKEKNVAALEGQLKERKNAEDIIEAAKEQMGETFKATAGEALASNNEQFLNLANENLGKTLEEAKGEFEKRHQQFQSLVKPLSDSYGKLNPTIESLTKQNQALAAEAHKLSTALTDNRRAGHWGEVQLRRVAELAGMADYCDFAEQQGSGAGRPDMVVRLPEGRAIVVDAKASLNAYLEGQKESDPEAVNAAWDKHARALRTQVNDLASKEYQSQVEGSLDFVAMFVPGDQFLAAALKADNDLVNEAAKKRIVIVTPASLIAMLWAVANGWQQQKLSENAEQIRQAGEEMYKRMTTFISHYQKVGKQLDSAVNAFNSSIGSFDSRVMAQGRKFAQLVGRDEESLSPPETIDALPRASRYAKEDGE